MRVLVWCTGAGTTALYGGVVLMRCRCTGRSAEEIGADQLLFQYYFSTSLARVLSIPSIHVEFDSAEEQSNLVRSPPSCSVLRIGMMLFRISMMIVVVVMIEDDGAGRGRGRG